VSSLVLVTGGAGFVGSHVVDELVERGDRVRVLDSLLPGAHGRRPDYLNPEAEYVWGDVRDPEIARAALRGADAVSHQAAMVGLGLDLGDIADYVSHNCLGTATLLGAMHDAGFAGRLVLASSMVVYGEGRYECELDGIASAPPRSLDDLRQGRFDPICPECGRALRPAAVSETAPADPRNVYAATKLHQEHLAAAFSREAGARATFLRYHNVYEPRMPRDTPYSGVAATFRSALERDDAPAVFEDGKQLRDFVHVRDVALANRLALDAPPGVDGAFNVASGQPRAVGDMARELSRVVAGPAPRVTGEFRRGDVRHVFASIDRARVELGYEPRVDFAAGLADFATASLR